MTRRKLQAAIFCNRRIDDQGQNELAALMLYPFVQRGPVDLIMSRS